MMGLTIGKIGWGALGALLLISPFLASSLEGEVTDENTPAYNWAYTEEASGLLQDIRALSAQVVEGADYLHSASQLNSLHWRSHAFYLNEIKTHVNTMGAKIDRLQEIHAMLAQWQQKTVEQITPSAVALATHTEETIAHVSENQARLWMLQYRNRVSAISDHGEEINRTVSMFLDYGKTSDRLKGLESQIEFAGT
jgi:hypothetical protein